jgi:hypothetical protein
MGKPDERHVRAGLNMIPIRRVSLALLLILCVSSYGCVQAAGAKRSDAAVPPGTGRALPSSAVPPSSTPELPSALPGLSPDEFWTNLFYGDPDFTAFASLGALIGASDAVAIVSLEQVIPGPSFDAGSNKTEFDAYVMVHVDRVLQGSVAQESVPVIVLLSLGANPAEAALRLVQLQTSMPKEEGILFLQNLVAWDKALSGSSTSRYDPTVYQVLSAQGVFRNANGVAQAARNAPGDWPKTFDGVDFGSVISSIASTKPDK